VILTAIISNRGLHFGPPCMRTVAPCWRQRRHVHWDKCGRQIVRISQPVLSKGKFNKIRSI